MIFVVDGYICRTLLYLARGRILYDLRLQHSLLLLLSLSSINYRWIFNSLFCIQILILYMLKWLILLITSLLWICLLIRALIGTIAPLYNTRVLLRLYDIWIWSVSLIFHDDINIHATAGIIFIICLTSYVLSCDALVCIIPANIERTLQSELQLLWSWFLCLQLTRIASWLVLWIQSESIINIIIWTVLFDDFAITFLQLIVEINVHFSLIMLYLLFV